MNQMGISGQDSSEHPPKERYGSHNTSGQDRAEIAVQIKAADFNGYDWDGRPFSAVPDWLRKAISKGAVLAHCRRHTDYCDWDVMTADGTVVSAEPGDWIILRENGDLSVVREQDAFILINLRPPVRDDNPEREA